MEVSGIKKFSVPILVIAVYLFLGFFRFSGLMAYIIPSVCWILVALTTLFIFGFEKIRAWFREPVTVMAALIAGFQICALVFTAFFTGFGRSPYQFTPMSILINIAYFLSGVVGLEVSRACLIKSCPKRKIILGMGLTALFYTFIVIPLASFTRPETAAEIAKFLGSEFLPSLAQSLLATYLALLGGPVASIAYVGTLEAFEWLSPILPNPEWFVKAFITTLVPMIGFYTLNETVNRFTLMRVGMLSRSEVTPRKRGDKKHLGITWMIIMLVSTLVLLSPTGLLGFQLSIVASGSMRPTIDTGDMAILVKTPAEKLGVGDVIQFWRDGDMIIHRVHEIQGGVIVTKGDANNAPDTDLVFPNQIQGKMVTVIPKLGWASIYLRQAFSSVYNTLTDILGNLGGI